VYKNAKLFSSLKFLLIWALVASLILLFVFDPGRALGVSLTSFAVFLGMSGADNLDLI
jgi:hypothetical protein